MTELKIWHVVFYHEVQFADLKKIIHVEAEDEEAACDKAWDYLAEEMNEDLDESIADYQLISAYSPNETSQRWKVTLNHSFTDEEKIYSVLAQDEQDAISVALSLAKHRDNLNTVKWDVWGCKKVPPGGVRPGAGRPSGRKTKPIRVPLENIGKVEKLDVVLDILREWKHRSKLNDKSARFYFLDKALEEIQEHWEKL